MLRGAISQATRRCRNKPHLQQDTNSDGCLIHGALRDNTLTSKKEEGSANGRRCNSGEPTPTARIGSQKSSGGSGGWVPVRCLTGSVNLRPTLKSIISEYSSRQGGQEGLRLFLLLFFQRRYDLQLPARIPRRGFSQHVGTTGGERRDRRTLPRRGLT